MNYTIKIFKNSDLDIVRECNAIAESHHSKNGGILEFAAPADESDYILCAIKYKEIIGYLCLKEYEIFKDSIYIESIATKKGYLNQGIAKNLLAYAISKCKKKYKKIIANVKKKNNASNELFKSYFFKEFEMKKSDYIYLEFKEEQIDKNKAYELSL